MCVELPCSIFFCAISNGFVWVLPLLLLSSCSLMISLITSAVDVWGRWSLEASVRALEQHSHTGTQRSGFCDPKNVSQQRPRGPSAA